MRDYNDYLVSNDVKLDAVLKRLDELGADSILFVVDQNRRLAGSITDGDVRRGLLKGIELKDSVLRVLQPRPKYLRKNSYTLSEVIELRKKNFRIIPVLNDSDVVVNVINFRFIRSYLPIDALIMAGGLGSRLRPLTNNIPKPLLKVGQKSIIDYTIDNLERHGVQNIFISVRYLGEQIENHIEVRESNSNIQLIWESEPLGTLGAASLIDNFTNDIVLITNADILTNIDYEKFVLDFIDSDSDMSVVGIPYEVTVPYAVMEIKNDYVVNFQEKPSFTYYSNGGIYLVKREHLDALPKNIYLNTTDLMDQIISRGGKLRSFPLKDYWTDIGRKEDYERANNEISKVEFK